MRILVRTLVASFWLFASVTVAQALTLREVVELSKAGISDEVLIDLIEVSRAFFPVDAETLLALKKAGLSDRLLQVIIRTARQPAPLPEPVYESIPPAPEPPTIVIVQPPEPSPQVVYVNAPTYVPVYVDNSSRRSHPRAHTTVIERNAFGRFINDGFRTEREVLSVRSNDEPDKPGHYGSSSSSRSGEWGKASRPGEWGAGRPGEWGR